MHDKPNWDKWKHIPQLQLWQAVALSLDMDPDSIDEDSFDYPSQRLPKNYNDRLQILAANLEAAGKNHLKDGAQFHAGYPRFNKVRTAAFAAWASQVWPAPQIPEELKALAVTPPRGGESNSGTQVDWHHWCHMDQWDLSHAICMLLAIEPDSRPGMMVSEQWSQPSADQGSALLEVWHKARKMRASAVASHKQGKLNPKPDPYAGLQDPPPMPPGDWLAWAARKEIEIPFELQPLAPADELPGLLEPSKGKASSDNSAESAKQAEDLDPRERTTYLNTIGALLELLLARNVAGNPRFGYESEARVIEALQQLRPHSRGIKERTLQDTFAAAKRELNKE
jgi:hypothetical protein